jgi:glycosyltransferase involved in cell wall biosynthesis
MNILIDDAIYRLQGKGGISTLWRALTPFLHAALPDFTFDPAQPADIFISTYYQPAPAGAKSIVMAYDYIQDRYPLLPSHGTDVVWKRSAVASADAVVAISEWTANDVRQMQGKLATVAYPATSLERASHQDVQAFKAKYGLPNHYVLIVGRRDLYKNVSAYWQALRLLPHMFTVCVGGAPMDSIQDSRQQLRLDANELAAAYTGARCLVYPSLYEGFGLPVLEAYACGCPVICGSGGALAEINEAACVVDVTRPRQIAEALLKMRDPGVRIEHILKGYDVSKRFSWAAMAESVAAVIRDVVERQAVND